MHADVIGPGDERWAAFLNGARHDFYHLPGYVQLSADQTDGEARAVIVADGPRSLLLPVVLRPIPGSRLDAASPYGYSGPLALGTDDRAWLGAALVEAEQALRRLGVVSLFVRSHPLLNAVPLAAGGVLVRHGETVSIDLTKPLDVLVSQTRRDHRRDIKRALRAGHAARWDEEWAHLETFHRIYRQTMDRVGADPFYQFGDVYFDRLRHALGESLRLCLVEIDGSVAAAALFAETCGIVQYHLSGTDPAFLRDRPTKLMIDFVCRWAKERGDSRLHLGGGVGAQADSLMLFKAGFSPDRHGYFTLRAVIDEAEYARLAGVGRGSLDLATGFFPAYRGPAGSG